MSEFSDQGHGLGACAFAPRVARVRPRLAAGLAAGIKVRLVDGVGAGPCGSEVRPGWAGSPIECLPPPRTSIHSIMALGACTSRPFDGWWVSSIVSESKTSSEHDGPDRRIISVAMTAR